MNEFLFLWEVISQKSCSYGSFEAKGVVDMTLMALVAKEDETELKLYVQGSGMGPKRTKL